MPAVSRWNPLPDALLQAAANVCWQVLQAVPAAVQQTGQSQSQDTQTRSSLCAFLSVSQPALVQQLRQQHLQSMANSLLACSR